MRIQRIQECRVIGVVHGIRQAQLFVCFVWQCMRLPVMYLLQAMLGALTCLLCAWTAFELFGRREAWITGVTLALLETAVAFPAYLLKPNLLLPVLAAQCLLSVRLVRGGGRPASWIALGALAGLLAFATL